MNISVIIPTLNEEFSIAKTLDAVSRLVNIAEIVVVDGGSSDKTIEMVENFQSGKEIKLVKISQANRGKQLDEGTKHASGDVFWFVHADTRPVSGLRKTDKRIDAL